MNVFVANEQAVPLDAAALRSIGEAVLRAEGYPEETEVSILLVEEAQIADLNARFLDKPQPTDVLAFPIEHLTPGDAPKPLVNGPPVVLGDVVIAPDYVRRQAESLLVPFADEMGLMVVHGLLHLLGYDHGEDGAAETMEQRERSLLAAAGLKRRR